MMNFYNASKQGQLLVEKVKKEKLPNYGIVDLNKKQLNINTPKKIKKLITYLIRLHMDSF